MGGHAVGLNFSIRYMFGLGPGDVMFCASDIGWVVGHSYIVYGPLLAGATTVLFEGKPIGTPDAGTFWRIVEEYKVKTMFTAPTALRAIRREDGDNVFFEKAGQRGGLKSLTALFLAGERSEPSIVTMYQRLLDKHCAPHAIVNDNWWSSESGSPISGLALNAAAGQDFHAAEGQKPLPIKAGSAGKPMPGFNVKVVDDDGNEAKQGTMGNIVLGIPLAPTGMTTLWQDEERFYKGYMKRFNGRWIDTGDAGMMDNDGYVHVMSRSDDVSVWSWGPVLVLTAGKIINVAAHRFSTGKALLPELRLGSSPLTGLALQARSSRRSHRIPTWRKRAWWAFPMRSKAISRSRSSRCLSTSTRRRRCQTSSCSRRSRARFASRSGQLPVSAG